MNQAHMPPIIAPSLLQRADKVLFVAHLALGDFTYMSRCFAAFHAAYPHIAIHIWVDELRRTIDYRQWAALRSYSLFDWLDNEPYIAHVYRRTYSPFSFAASLRQARRQRYPIVISFGLSRRTFYARLVRRISPHGFVVAIGKPFKPFDLVKRRTFGRLDAVLQDRPPHAVHISQIYANWFLELFGMPMTAAQRMPVMSIPSPWLQRAAAWASLDACEEGKTRRVFINPFSKQDERSWPFSRALELVRAMQSTPGWHDARFVLNCLPQQREQCQASLRDSGLARTGVFSATDNFFELPAMLAQCDLIISVETATIHLAQTVGVPVIALMRQLSPEWVPLDAANAKVVMVDHRDGWVKDIPVQAVLDSLPA
ncbi:glycosyltransferase family 9 protein [Herbaspirillum sp. YR522]|uniref:glycosyltransferase family 9 protein n=1 Tax=Herbaspirillum sp. YR522 TaxID=1144342 RepID=UPI00026F6550|nr:glycosyltransferase family 9 protein [Herbaspirillum sp. YR522]EJN01784.1 ADP-heptose:LPS heptosyltransferase [Herbaspirillum sp. YR522]